MDVTDGLIHAVHQLQRQCCCAILMPAQRSVRALINLGGGRGEKGSSLMPERKLLLHTLACAAQTKVSC